MEIETHSQMAAVAATYQSIAREFMKEAERSGLDIAPVIDRVHTRLLGAVTQALDEPGMLPDERHERFVITRDTIIEFFDEL